MDSTGTASRQERECFRTDIFDVVVEGMHFAEVDGDCLLSPFAVAGRQWLGWVEPNGCEGEGSIFSSSETPTTLEFYAYCETTGTAVRGYGRREDFGVSIEGGEKTTRNYF